MSIRFKLTLFYTLTLAIIVLLLGMFLSSFLSEQLLSDLDQSLETTAETIAAAFNRGQGMRKGIPKVTSASTTLYQIITSEGQIEFAAPALAEGQILPVDMEAVSAAFKENNVWVTHHLEDENFRFFYAKINNDYIVQLAAPLVQIERPLERLKTLLISGGITALMLAFLAGWFLASSALRPIQKITATAASINDTKDLTRRVTYSGPKDEIGQLTDTFNIMLKNLQSAYTRLEESNRSQIRFVSDASHELRTPLTVIRGNVELLEKVQKDNNNLYQDALADIAAESRRMSRMVDNLLYLARHDQKKIPQLQSVKAEPIIKQAARNAELMAKEKQITFNTVLQDKIDHAFIMANPDDFYRLLMILLDNAVKYTPAGGEISLFTSTTDQKLKISVTDTGIGIDPKDSPYIFDRFFRADASRSTEGTGLGLSIAKQIADYHNAQIEAESMPAAGTKFTFIIDLIGDCCTIPNPS